MLSGTLYLKRTKFVIDNFHTLFTDKIFRRFTSGDGLQP